MSDTNVIPLYSPFIGDGITLNPDTIIDGAKDAALATVVIVGETKDGVLYLAGSEGAGDTLMLLHRAISQLVEQE